jgi:hypothetical protein
VNPAYRTILVVLAAAMWPGSLFVAWIMATPMGFGARWEEYSLGGQMFFLAPLIVLPIAVLVGLIGRRLWLAAATLLAAPLYQALHLGASFLLSTQV